MTLLQGPADADNYRIKVGRYSDRWYTDPLPACAIAPASDWQGPSVSTTKPPFANKFVTLKSIATMPDDEWARLADLDANARYEAIKAHEKLASRINMDRGTLVHTHAEDRLLQRMALPVSGSAKARAEAERFFPALDAFLNDYQPELIAAETVCLHRTLNGVGYGGTADAFVKIDGATWAVDWKSRNSDHDAYLEEGAQGGAYIGAEYMIVAGDDGAPTRVRIPEVAGVLIVSIREDGYRAFPIDGAAAIDAYHAMHAWWCAQRHYVDRGAKRRPWAPKAAAPAVDSGPEPANLDRAILIERVKALVDSGHGERLTKRWPAGVPGFKTDHDHSVDERRQILAAIQQLEDETSAPFHPADHTPPPPPAPPAAQKPPRIDNGPHVDDAHHQALKERYDKLPATDRERIETLALAVGVNEHRSRGSGNYTRRHWAIVRALVLWAEIGWDDEIIRDLTAACLDDEAARQPAIPLAAAIGQLTIEQANQLADMSRQISAGSHRLDSTPGHWQLLPAA